MTIKAVVSTLCRLSDPIPHTIIDLQPALHIAISTNANATDSESTYRETAYSQTILIAKDTLHSATIVTAELVRMCFEVYHILACGHNINHRSPSFELHECGYTKVAPQDRMLWEDANGKHHVLRNPAQNYDQDLTSICENCRDYENWRVQQGLPLQWPDATETARLSPLVVE